MQWTTVATTLIPNTIDSTTRQAISIFTMLGESLGRFCNLPTSDFTPSTTTQCLQHWCRLQGYLELTRWQADTHGDRIGHV